MDDVLYLLSSVSTQDDNGVWRETLTETQVFCTVGNITRAEFFNAGRNGLNPQFEFTIFFGDYGGQELLKYNGEVYSIYRTYRTDSDYLELYAEKKGGTHGKSVN